jgi:hypothetical protein
MAVDVCAILSEHHWMSNWFAQMRSIRRYQIMAAALVMVAALWSFTLGSIPPVEALDGNYSNPCCQEIQLHNGEIIFGNEHVRFALRNMRFGLVARPTRDIEIDEHHRVKFAPDTSYGASILFDGDRKGFVMAGPLMGELHFVRR